MYQMRKMENKENLLGAAVLHKIAPVQNNLKEKKELTERITKKMLKDYAKTKREIPLLRAELNTMINSEYGLGNSVIMDYSKGFPSPQGVVGFDQERYDRRRAILEKKEGLVAVVDKWIDDIEDVQTRKVFEMRYTKEMSWTKIAKNLGFSSADYARIMIRDKYLIEKNIK